MKIEQIIKALECCPTLRCRDCPYKGEGGKCVDKLISDAHSLIVNQNAKMKKAGEAFGVKEKLYRSDIY